MHRNCLDINYTHGYVELMHGKYKYIIHSFLRILSMTLKRMIMEYR